MKWQEHLAGNACEQSPESAVCTEAELGRCRGNVGRKTVPAACNDVKNLFCHNDNALNRSISRYVQAHGIIPRLNLNH